MRITMTRGWSASASVALALSLAAAEATAQDRLFVRGANGSFEIGALGRFGEVLGPGYDLEQDRIVGGRFVVRGATEIVDLRTGATTSLPVSGVPIAYDRARPRVFVARPTAANPSIVDVVMIDAASGRAQAVLTTAACAGDPTLKASHAVDSDTLFVERCGPLGSRGDIVALDLTIPVPAPRVVATGIWNGAPFDVTPDGSRLFVSTAQGVDAVDTSTTAVIASTDVGWVSRLAWDDAAQWLLVTSGLALDARLSAYTVDLGRLGAAAFPGTGPCPARLFVSAHTGRWYLFTGGSDYYTAPLVRVTAFSGGVAVASAELPRSAANGCAAEALRTAPGAPRAVTAAVTGRDVSLRWSNVGAASAFVLEAGLAPGRTDAIVPLGPDSHVTFTGVPPGTYYLRMRGVNEFGAGRWSNEVRVVVP